MSVKHDDMSNPIEEIKPKMGTRSSQDSMKTQHHFTPKDNRFFTTLVMLLVVRDEPEKALRKKEYMSEARSLYMPIRDRNELLKNKEEKTEKPRGKNKHPLNLK